MLTIRQFSKGIDPSDHMNYIPGIQKLEYPYPLNKDLFLNMPLQLKEIIDEVTKVNKFSTRFYSKMVHKI